MKKKLVSSLLAVCMAVSLLTGMGISARADESSESITSGGISISTQTFDKLMTEVVNASINAENDGEIDFMSTFDTSLYVKSNGISGITSDITIQFPRDCCCGSLYLPCGADTSAIMLAWDDAKLKLYDQNGTEVYSGQAPVGVAGESITYKAVKENQSADIKITTMEGSSGVQSMFINIDEDMGTVDAMNNDPDHETDCYGTLTQLTSGKAKDYYISIKGRGNSTWDMVKKPYNLTFYKTSDYNGKKDSVKLISDGKKSKKWSLLANYFDTSLLRNKVAMDLAKELGIGLDADFVDVWVNGQYYGNYTLTQKNDFDTPDEGYALEEDNYYSDGDISGEDYQFKIPEMQELGETLSNVGDLFTGYYNRITVKDIGDDALNNLNATEEDMTNANTAIEEHFDKAWEAVLDYDSEEYQKYFDIESWAKMYLMYEVSKQYDTFAGSILMYREGTDEDDKIIAGPAWDYDNSFGRNMYKFFSGVSLYTQISAEGWFVDSIGLVADKGCDSMLQEFGRHESFMQEVAKIYYENIDAFEGLVDNINTQADIIEDSALMNTDLWDLHHLNTYFIPVPLTIGTGKYAFTYKITDSWRAFVDNMCTYCEKRVSWLTDHLDNGSTSFAGSITNNEGTLEVSVTSGNAAGYQWQYSSDGTEWTDIDSATESAYTPEDNGNYRCIVTSNGTKMVTTNTGIVQLKSKIELEPITVTN